MKNEELRMKNFAQQIFLGEPLRFARVGLSAPSPSPSRLRRFGFGGSATIPLATGLIGSLRGGLRRSAILRHFIFMQALGRHIGLPLH
jgi:hypothetical protein